MTNKITWAKPDPPPNTLHTAFTHLKAVEATCTPEHLHCAAESREAHNPKIVVRYCMAGRAQLVDVARPERNSRPSGAQSSGVSYLGIRTQ